jgi:hypothetical protein
MKHASTGGGFVLVQVFEREAHDKLKSIKVAGLKGSLWDYIQERKRWFLVRRVVFDCSLEDNEDERKNSFVIFQGYKYEVLPNPDYSLIELFLEHVKHIISSDNEQVYNYIMCWFASILQISTFKNKVMLLIQGGMGSGKTLFTNVICQLLGEYGPPNVKDSHNITGHFNSMIENRN